MVLLLVVVVVVVVVVAAVRLSVAVKLGQRMPIGRAMVQVLPQVLPLQGTKKTRGNGPKVGLTCEPLTVRVQDRLPDQDQD